MQKKNNSEDTQYIKQQLEELRQVRFLLYLNLLASAIVVAFIVGVVLKQVGL